MDVSDTIVAKSDQMNADDLLAGPIVVTIERVTRHSEDQPLNVHVTGRQPWRPSKGMRRVLCFAWGPESDAWIGRSVELYREPEITRGKEKVGGIRIARMSHIDRPFTIAIAERRGHKVPYNIGVLKPADKPDSDAFRKAIEGDIGIRLDDLDDYLTSQGKPAASDMDETGKRALYRWLKGDGADQVRLWLDEQAAQEGGEG